MSGFVYVGNPVAQRAPPHRSPVPDVVLSTVVEQLVSAVDETLATASAAPEASAPVPALLTVIPVFTKAYEDSMLRPAAADEVVCLSGVHCECMQMARFPPHNCPELGFHGVAALNGYCVLCLRVKVAKCYYLSAISPRGSTQTMRNLIESGEYSRDCCFLPTASNTFLTDPVVMHQRNNYRYSAAGLKQLRSVNFLAPRGMSRSASTSFAGL